MLFSVRIERDSINEFGDRLTTFVCTYERFIHSELMTHRMFSRNAASSRAIPVEKRIEQVLAFPAMPIEFGQNKRGMQAGESLSSADIADSKMWWLQARDEAVRCARRLIDIGLHKQHANRILEPFSWITTIISSTTFSNFFALRNHEAAQPEFRRLAEEMENAYARNEPERRRAGEWHLPFIRFEDVSELGEKTEQLRKVSVARCARVSYENHDGVRSVDDDLTLFGRLADARPMHASAFEHVAQASGYDPAHEIAYLASGNQGNFQGWRQYRKAFPREHYDELQLKNLRAAQGRERDGK
jgi:thymidylate synthase ThyX